MLISQATIPPTPCYRHHELFGERRNFGGGSADRRHADSRTTKLYDRRGQKVLLEDMERIRY
jgi:hypothetical protein